MVLRGRGEELVKADEIGQRMVRDNGNIRGTDIRDVIGREIPSPKRLVPIRLETQRSLPTGEWRRLRQVYSTPRWSLKCGKWWGSHQLLVFGGSPKKFKQQSLPYKLA